MEAARLLDEPIYTVADTARLVHLTPSRVRRWLSGYEYDSGPPAHRRRTKKPPIVTGRGNARRCEASFLDLVELLIVKTLLEHGLTLQKLRQVASELSRKEDVRHPFATQRFYLLGTKLFVELGGRLESALLETRTGGQLAMKDLIAQCATQIDFDRESKLAKCWWPMGKSRRVVVTPERAFGAPTVANRAVKTSNVYSLYVGERENVDRVAHWLDLSKQEVIDAVEFEKSLAAA
jgi:uncharacterized protein (DUF433 family)